MELGLRDAKVFVAASSAGLGRATARQFSLEGALVAINGRGGDRLKATADAIRAESGRKVIALVGDVAAEPAALVERAAAELGGLDVLVTNAGGPPPGTFDTITQADWNAALELTLTSVVKMIRAALPYLRQSDRAAILTITSVSVKQPVDNLLLSNSIRMAVIGLTKTLANEIAPEGIRVNSILPGFTMTDRVTELLENRAHPAGITVEEQSARQAAGIPLRRIGKPEEFGNVAVFLCSPAASYVTGVMMPVDGGTIQATL